VSTLPPIQPSFAEFGRHFANSQTQLVWTDIPGDLETPVGVALKLFGHDPYSFLLESVEGGNVLGRYSILGAAPDLLWKCTRGVVETKAGQDDWKAENSEALSSLKNHVAACRIDVAPPDLPPMAVSGLFGYMGYDMIRLVENLPDSNPDRLGIPDSILMRPSVLVVFDNVRQTITLVCPVYDHAGKDGLSAQEAYDRACGIIARAHHKLHGPADPALLSYTTQGALPLIPRSNMTREEYHAIVKKAVDYTFQGEIFQVVPSQRFTVDFDLPAFELYRALRRLNPSPFMFYIAFADFHLVGASPEILVRVREGEITVRPIAGTRARGATIAEDNALAEDLLSDQKERAEHLMLLDLGRNDVGRVSEYGSVKVTDSFIIERYSHVMHIVSNVTGKLRADHDIIDALFAGFPAGTVSGAPKVRAMEIIDELENTRRGFYGGGVGYLSGNGTLDTCIALRTGLLKDGKLHIQAGGGVVADSDPEFEYQETISKSRALIRAAETAIQDAAARTSPAPSVRRT
jgi:anthranilate synthase component I